MAKYVKCYYCGERFDRDKIPFIAVPGMARRYAHLSCHEKKQQGETVENEDKIKLEEYIKKLFNVEYVPPLAQKQIKEFVNERGYSYSGMLKTLKYHYEIKHGDISKAHNGVGIIPYLYDDAYRYYFAIWQAQQENKKIIEQEKNIFVPEVVEIHIKSPKREVMGRRRKNFFFLDEEGQVDE